MTKIRNNNPKRRFLLVRPSGPHRDHDVEQRKFSAQAKHQRVSTGSRPLPVALTSGTRKVKPSGCSGGEVYELMEGGAVCTRCKEKGSACFRTGSTKRGRGRPAKHPVIVGTTTYGRCESCKSANITCTTIAPTGQAPIPTLRQYQPPTGKKPEPERPASPPVAGPGPSSSAFRRSRGTAATVDPERSPIDIIDPLWEEVNAGVKDAIISVAHSIATLQSSLDQLNDISYVLGEPEYSGLRRYSPQAQMPAGKAQDLFDKPNNTVGQDILPPIQKAITVSSASIHRIQGAFDCLLAVRPLLPPIIDSDYESDDES